MPLFILHDVTIDIADGEYTSGMESPAVHVGLVIVKSECNLNLVGNEDDPTKVYCDLGINWTRFGKLGHMQSTASTGATSASPPNVRSPRSTGRSGRRHCGAGRTFFVHLAKYSCMVLEPTAASNRAWTSRTYGEVNEIAAEDGSVAVVPVGAVEQHGHHLPVGTDTLLVSAVAKAGCERAHEGLPVLFTPAIWCGLSEMHRGFGGGISLSVRTMAAVLEDIGASVLDCGFDAVLFLDGHAGNDSVIGDAIASLGRDRPDQEVLGVPYAQLARPVVDEVRESDPGGMFHAAEFETSLALELFAELVDEDAAEGEPLNAPYEMRAADFFDGGPLSVYLHFDRYSDSGAVGEPELASAAKGERLFDAITDELAALLERIYQENRD